MSAWSAAGTWPGRSTGSCAGPSWTAGCRPGGRLPPTRELARRLSVSRTTVTVAYDRLTGEGFVTSRRCSRGRPEFDFRAGIPGAQLFPYRTWRQLLAR
jgi:GntR family transcriptional regulator/MocR family aminotransferase